MTPQDNAAQRLIIGVCGVLCLVTSGAVWYASPSHDGVQAAFLRVGLVMSALWLALPPQGRSVAWAKAAPIIVGLVVVIVLSKKAFLAVLPIVAVVGVAALILRPRPKRRRS